MFPEIIEDGSLFLSILLFLSLLLLRFERVLSGIDVLVPELEDSKVLLIPESLSVEELPDTPPHNNAIFSITSFLTASTAFSSGVIVGLEEGSKEIQGAFLEIRMFKELSVNLISTGTCEERALALTLF